MRWGWVGAGVEVGGGEEDELAFEGWEVLLGGRGFEEAAADTVHDTLDHGGYESGVSGEGLGEGLDEGEDGLVDLVADALGDDGAVKVCTDGVEGCAGAGVMHFGVEESGHEGGHHGLDGLAAALAGDVVHGGGDLIEVALERGAEERGTCWGSIGRACLRRLRRGWRRGWW